MHNDRVYPRDDFEAVEKRRLSPEWDFGVHWRFSDHGPDFPRYRVSWIVETGELYAVAAAGPDSRNVYVLAVVEKVGDYPYARGGVDGYSRVDSWTAFKNEQEIEKLLEGWADAPLSLDWVRQRVATARAA